MLLTFERLVHLVVSHTEDAQLTMSLVAPFAEDDELGDKRHSRHVGVQFRCHSQASVWVDVDSRTDVD
jgi:hypothetical protein